MNLGLKKCLLCEREFRQGKPPKAEQVYCSYACFLQSSKGGLW